MIIHVKLLLKILMIMSELNDFSLSSSALGFAHHQKTGEYFIHFTFELVIFSTWIMLNFYLFNSICFICMKEFCFCILLNKKKQGIWRKIDAKKKKRKKKIDFINSATRLFQINISHSG